jgi:hypothetical protein
MKRNHEAEVEEHRRSKAEAARDAAALAYTEIVDQWERRFAIDDWFDRMSDLLGPHPQIKEAHFDNLTAGREWLFGRVWPGTIHQLEAAFRNFGWVCSDLQLTLSHHPHQYLAQQGIVAIARFYNDPAYWEGGKPDERHSAMYDFYSSLVRDLALELTRAANLVCDVVRERLDARYRLEQGVVTMWSGPYHDGPTTCTGRITRKAPERSLTRACVPSSRRGPTAMKSGERELLQPGSRSQVTPPSDRL